jgi:lipoprotein-anchoring transpeptidase ErfK/SrfK
MQNDDETVTSMLCLNPAHHRIQSVNPLAAWLPNRLVSCSFDFGVRLMTGKSSLVGLALAALVGVVGTSAPANAQSLGDLLWGGTAEYGGGKGNISFSSQYKPGQIVVSFGDRRLYLITSPGQALSYPIAIPREQSRWQGTTFISQKRVNPSWTPTPEMIRENPRLPSWVPGGHPMNPLGVRALYLGSSAYRIHGTDAPWTIGQNVSKGCVRMYNDDVIDLYNRVNTGTRVTVTWQRFKGGPPVASNSGDGGFAMPKPKKYYRPAQPRPYSTSMRKAPTQQAEVQ